MDYLDFEIEIGKGLGREYPVAVIRSPAGEACETMRFPFDELALENRLLVLQNALLRSGGASRRALSPEEQTVQNFGRDLFESLVSGEVRSRFDVSLSEARQQGKGLRVKLRFQGADLAALPWEFLYDQRRGEYLCLSKNTPTIRYLELPQPIPKLKMTPPLRILGMVASPADLPQLDVEREKQRIERAIQDLTKKGFLYLEWLPGQTWRSLQEAMGRGGPWHIFHFIGHGGFDPDTDEGLIALADERGQKKLLTATQLANVLADHYDLRLVLLNSCEGARAGKLDIYSSTAAILVRRGIASVLAMQYEISDRAAIEFSRTFYDALAYGLPIDTAVATARIAVNIEVNNSLEWGTPVLYMRSPDGVLFDLASVPPDKPEMAIAEFARETPPIEADLAEPAPLKPEVTKPELFEPEIDPKAPKQKRKIRSWLIGVAGVLALLLITVGLGSLLGQLEKRVTNSIGMNFVLIPSGTFQMGSPSSESGRSDAERQHQVTISQPFYLQATEVTQEQWQRVMGNNPSHFKKAGKDYPVEQVSWDDIQEFLTKLNQMEKTDKYRLPTEAEWEYACRAGSSTSYSFGDDVAKLKEFAWYFDNSEYRTHPVTQRKPNNWGLFDMHGNVFEWCQDWHGPYPIGPVTDPRGPVSGGYRVLRGGGFRNPAWITRSAARGFGDPVKRVNDVGFRVAFTPSRTWLQRILPQF